MLNLALADGMLFLPGAGWSYSNIGYLIVREAIEKATEKPLGALLKDLILAPLCLNEIEMAESRAQFATLHWPDAARYDPAWVYHGCLIGTAEDAARLLHALFTQSLLRQESLDQMRAIRNLGGALSGRPWETHGYGLGLMSGRMQGAGLAVGHSGGGPFCVNAVYHFPDRADPVTVAAFTDGTDEGVAEFAAARLATEA